MNFMTKKNRAFTILELMVSVSIVAILSALSFENLIEYKDRVDAASIAADFKNIGLAIRTSFNDQGFVEWPTEADLGAGGNPTIASLMVSNTTLQEILGTTPTPTFQRFSPNTYVYDNDGNTYDRATCGHVFSGVNLALDFNEVSEVPRIASLVNNVMERDKISVCGNLRTSGRWIVNMLGVNSRDFF